jgi:hypothetical protein
MAGESPTSGLAAAGGDDSGGVDWGVVRVMAAFMTAKSSTGATV